MIFRINHCIERGGKEYSLQIEAEYQPTLDLLEVTHNGRLFVPTLMEEAGIMRALWVEIEERSGQE
jgi:hypothetical protein